MDKMADLKCISSVKGKLGMAMKVNLLVIPWSGFHLEMLAKGGEVGGVTLK